MEAAAKYLLFTLFFGIAFCQKQTQEDPCKTKSRVVPDATYCDRYWECQDGQPELYDCPNGLVYAGKNRGVTEGCDYPWRANYCEGKTQANPPIGKDHCDWLYGIFGHETSCTRYWTCWNGTATEQLCIGGLLYNENTRSCDWPENVDGCQKHPLCNEEANGNVPLGKSCNRYWQCQGGYPRLQRCPAMLVFDKRTLRCVVPPTEDCEAMTTIAPPLEEDEEEPNVPRPQHQSSRPSQHYQAKPQQFQSVQPEQQHQSSVPNIHQSSRPSQHYQAKPQPFQPEQEQPEQQHHSSVPNIHQSSRPSQHYQPKTQQLQQQQQQQHQEQNTHQQNHQTQQNHQQRNHLHQNQQSVQQRPQQFQQRQDYQQNYNNQAQQRSDDLPPQINIPPGAIPLTRTRARNN